MYTWSYSALKDYVNCPRQYNEVKVLKNYTKSMTKQILYGQEVHKALEDYVREGKPLLKNYEQYKDILDCLMEIPGTRYPEHEMGLTIDKTACGFNDSNRWVRGIADLLIVDEEDKLAYIVDYKTGSNRYPDVKQLKLMALMTFAHFPVVDTVKAGLLFIVKNSFVDEIYKREEIPQLWSAFESDLMRLEASYKHNVWNPNSTPLCGWCPVKTCEYHKGNR